MPTQVSPAIPPVYIKFFLGLLSAAVVGLFVWVWNAQSSLTVLSLNFTSLKENITKDMEELKEDTGSDAKQDSQLSKHWKLHNWARGRINTLETNSSMPLSEWPDLGPPG